MPEYRCDPLTGQTVLIAEERMARPHQFDIENNGSDAKRAHCPFCEGNEMMTPCEFAAYRPADSPRDATGWQVRVIQNKYPAVLRDDERFPDCTSFQNYLAESTVQAADAGSPIPIEGVGHHEVIVETPRHILCVSEMTETEAENMFRIYGERIAALRQENRWAFVQIFKNVGAAAGASIPHSHSQLIAMPFIPNAFRQLLKNAADYRNKTQRCYWCSMLETELTEQKRIIEETEHFVALCPFASRFAGEIKVYPKKHQADFDAVIADETVLSEFALLVRRMVQKLKKTTSRVSKNMAYNFVLHSNSFVLPTEYKDDNEELFHWSLTILPSLARAAGFEWGTALHINPVSPETAAKMLRDSFPPCCNR